MLVPVELDRTSVRTCFHVRYTAEDIRTNLSLQAKLKVGFRIDLPEIEDNEDLDLPAYFEKVRTAVREVPRWAVDEKPMALGFFALNKLLMYEDLDAAAWPEQSKPQEHTILRSLLEEGFASHPPDMLSEGSLDGHVDPADIAHVIDADSSQAQAIVEVLRGRSLVIQGPPGTGKSQTITNLIAEAIAKKKRVLFVSEKMAALDVVKRRLDHVGLGDACLELHSNRANKKKLLDELHRTRELGRPQVAPDSELIPALRASRDRLNAYCEAVNTTIGASEVTPYVAFGELLRLDAQLAGVQCPRLDGCDMQSWSREAFKRRHDLVSELQALVERMGTPAEHPFWGSRHRVFLPSDRQALVQ